MRNWIPKAYTAGVCCDNLRPNRHLYALYPSWTLYRQQLRVCTPFCSATCVCALLLQLMGWDIQADESRQRYELGRVNCFPYCTARLRYERSPINAFSQLFLVGLVLLVACYAGFQLKYIASISRRHQRSQMVTKRV